MRNGPGSREPDTNAPMPIGKAIGGLLLLYVLIGGSAIWQLRRTCLLEREDCGYAGLLEWILSNRLSSIGSAIILGLLVFVTWHFVVLARTGKLGVEQDPPKRKFNVSGLLVSLVVFLLYLTGYLILLTSGIVDPAKADPSRANVFVWKTLGPMYGCAFVFIALWHLNDYFVKPVSGIVLFLLFAATFGSIYLLLRSTFLTI